MSAHTPHLSTTPSLAVNNCSYHHHYPSLCRRIWMPVEGMRPYLLLCPDRKQFVVLLAREPDTKVGQLLSQRTVKTSPILTVRVSGFAPAAAD